MPETPPLSCGSAQERFCAYLALILVILFFSGLAPRVAGRLGFLDFLTLNGAFGTMSAGTNFLGQHGQGVKHGFLFAFSLIPGIMFALGVVEAAEKLGALRAAQYILSPLLRPLLGLPGAAGLALVASLQSTDAGAAMTSVLRERGLLNERELAIFGMFQFSSGASVVVYLTIGLALFPLLSVPYLLPLGVIFFWKIVGANLMRLYLTLTARREKQP